VECEFTKETNKRMSVNKSVSCCPEGVSNYLRYDRQVSDLEKENLTLREEVDKAKREVNKLLQQRHHILADEEAMNHSASSKDLASSLRLERKRKRTDGLTFVEVRKNMENFGEGILSSPHTLKSSPLALKRDSLQLPKLPSRAEREEMLVKYKAGFQSALPILEWSPFVKAYAKVSDTESLDGMATDWIAMLFAVFACSCLCGDVPNSRQYYETAKSYVNMWTDAPTVDSIRAMFLMSVYLVEVNNRAAAWNILGLAIRTSQDMGLDQPSNRRLPVSEDMRKRIWFSLGVHER
jgi:hypothetical protein